MGTPQEQLRPRIAPEQFFQDASPDYPSMAREAASRNNVDPNIFERQIAHESANYDPDVIAGRRKSSKGAMGIAQFIESTGARYGLRGDDFYDPPKALNAAARHMRDLLDQTGDDYEAALAGYNAGIGRVRDNSWRNIPETRNYTSKILGGARGLLKPKVDPDSFFASGGTQAAPTAEAPARLAPRSTLNIDQSAFTDTAPPAPSARFDFASKFPGRTPAQQIADGAVERQKAQAVPRSRYSTPQSAEPSTAFAVPPPTFMDLAGPQGDPTRFPEVVITPQSEEGRAYANEMERRKHLHLAKRIYEKAADVVMGTHEDASRMGFLESQRRGLESVAGAATQFAGEAGGVAALPLEAAGRAVGSPELEHSGDLSREMQQAAAAERQRNPGLIPELARSGTDIALSLPAFSAKIPALAMGALSAGRALGRGESPTAALGEGLLAAGPLFVLQGSPLGGLARETVTRALSPEASEALASEASAASRLTRYQKLQALANDASTTDAERAVASARARAVADTLKESSQAEIDKAVGVLRQHLMANVAGMGAQAATNAAQFIGTSAALELGIKGRSMTAAEIVRQGVMLLAFEAAPILGAAGEAGGQIRDFRDAEAARRSLNLEGNHSARQPVGEARQLSDESGAGPVSPNERPVGPSGPYPLESTGEQGGPELPKKTQTGPAIIHTPLGRPVDPEVVRDEVGREVGAANPQIAGSEVARSSSSSEAANPATAPESAATLNAQLESLRRARSDRELAFGPELEQQDVSRRAVLVTPGEQMPASKGALESEGFAVTKTPVGVFVHDPREVSRQDVKRKAADGTFHDLLGIVEPKSDATTEAVVARHPETGVEQQAALVSPDNVPAQSDSLKSQVPESMISLAPPGGALAERAGLPEGAAVVADCGDRFRVKLPSGRYEEIAKPIASPVDAAAHEAATSPANQLPEPTEPQKEAGNYRKGHIKVAGLDVSIENPEGSQRKPEWPPLKSHYGYIRRTEGGDGEQIDAFIKPGTPEDYSGPVFVVDQQNANGAFDEHKAMIGWPDETSARAGYAENFTAGWKVGPIRTFANVDEFRDWLRTADTTKPAVTGKEQLYATETGIGLGDNGPELSGVRTGPNVPTHPEQVREGASGRAAGGGGDEGGGQVEAQPAPVKQGEAGAPAPEPTRAATNRPKKKLAPRSLFNNEPPGGWTEADKVPEKYRKKPVAPSEKSVTIPPEVGNEPTEDSTRTVGQGAQAPSAEVLPETPSATLGKRPAEPGSVQSAREREGQVRPTERSGHGTERGEGTSAEGVRLSDTARGRGPSGELGESGGRVEPTERGDVDAGKGPAEGHQAQPASHTAGNFRIKDVGELTAGGAKTKFRQNIQAIQTLRQIEAEGRAATAEEHAILVRYSGWGQFPGAFNPYTREGSECEKPDDQLRELMSDEEFEASRQSTLNAHYTAPEIVQAMWDAAVKLGFAEGRLLEPSMGIGHFFGLLPSKLRSRVLPTGVELDETTGKMAKLLYPKANVQIKGFEKLQVPDGFYDFAIGNVPFGDYRVHDPDYNKFRANIHDYFFLKSLDKVRPGGVVMFITSTGTMDKADPRIRRLIADKADLVAAMRFPSQTFQKSAGTSVVTDLIILRRRGEDEEPGGQAWLDTKEVTDPDRGSPIPVNEYYAAHPDQILGRLDRRGSMYRADAVNVTRTDDFDDRFKAATGRPPANGNTGRTCYSAFDPQRLEAPEELKQFNYAVRDGKLYQKQGDHLVEQQADKTTVSRVSGMVAVRDALRQVFNSQLLDMSKSEQESARASLNRVYDSFVRRLGYLSDAPNKRAIADDPDAPLLLALENYDPQKKRATKSEVFTKNTVRSYQRPTKAATAAEALGISLHDTGVVALDRIGEVLGVTAEEGGRPLVAKGLAFNDPSEGFVAKDLYLSGNVRQKLVQAREAAKADPQFEPNVAALEKVQPEDIPHTDITVKLGAPWVAPDDVADFAAHLLQGSRENFRVSFLRAQGQWIAEYSNSGMRLSHTQLAQAVWGTPRAGFMTLLQSALADKPVVVYDKDGDKTYVNNEASAAANAKVKEIRDAFDEWIWEGDERRDRLHRYYNDNFNNIRTIDYTADHYKDENGDYQFPGMNPGIRLRPHQANAVWQIVSTGRALLAHEVGTGKTFTMVTGAMELRRLGLAKKPAIAVPKAIIEGFVKDAQYLYPNAKIITTEGRFDAARRRETVSRIATGDYDMVILTHDNLDMLPMKPETVQAFIKREIEELEQAKAVAQEEDDRKDNKVVKQLEKAKAKLEARLQDAIEGSKKDNAVFFEETGIDQLFVDEAHKYKSLPVYTSRTRIKGIPTSRSDRATNMLMRTRWLQENQGGRGVAFATGTPIANTMVELYNMQRYLQYPELEERGIASFDGWANTFGETSTKMEYSVSGTYQPVTRFAKYSNLPELLQISRQVMDVRRADDMPESIKRPKKIEEVISVPMSDEQQSYLREIQARAKWVKENPRLAMQKGYDNMLKISTDARKSAMDMRLVEPGADLDAENKAAAVVERVLEIHAEKPNITQMIFSDIGINPTDWGFSIYKEIVRQLVAGGIPRERIIDFSTLTDTQKRTAVEKLRTGKALVGIGSTDKMGTGVNAQDHLYALHHIDAPWLPASVEQRDGRGWRQGNNNPEIKIYRYVTTGSFDTFMWQVLDSKSRFIKQAMEGRVDQRSFKEEDTEELTPAKVMAIASGNPHLLAKVQLDEDIAELERARRRREQAQVRFKQDAAYIEKQKLPDAEALLTARQSDWTQVEATADKDFSITVKGKKYTERKQAATDLTVESARALKHVVVGKPEKIGEIRGFDIVQGSQGTWLKREDTYSFQVNDDEPAGTLRSLESVLRNIEGRVAASQRIVDQLGVDLETAQKQIGVPFKQAEQLATKRRELVDVEAKLSAKKEETPQGDEAPALSAREQARQSLAETKKEERRSREAGFVTIPEGRGGQPPKPPSGEGYRGFEDDEMERRWKEAKGLPIEPLSQKVREVAAHLKRLATRDLEHLPRTGQHAELNFALHRLAQGKGIASDEAVRILQSLTAKLNKAKYDLFTRRIILDDLLEGTERQADAGDAETRLPFGFTPETLLAESRRLNKELDDHPDVEEAVGQRRAVVREVTGDYLKAAKQAIGFEPKLSREHYYRHQVLAHAEAARVKGTGDKVAAPTGRGFLKQRHGSELDINTDYLQAEHSVLAQMLYDTQVFRLIHLVDQNYNISESLKRQAKVANDEAIQVVIDKEDSLFGTQPRKPTKKQTLSQFVRAHGGIRDDGCDEIGRLKLKESGTTGLVTKGGKTPDGMREAAVEAGFFFDEPDSTYATHADNFLNAVEDDLRGIKGRYSGEHIDDIIAQNEGPLFLSVGEQMKLFKQKIGRGFAELRGLADSGEIWTGDNNEWESAVRRLTGHRNFDEDLSERNSLFKYIAALAANEEATGNLQARIILKAISNRRAFVRKTLGKDFKEWHDLVPEGTALWQPREGNIFFNAYTLPEKLANAAIEHRFEQMGFEADDLRRAMVIGGRRREFAIPEEVATTLDEFMKPRDSNPLDRAVRAVVRSWKVWQLISPHRLFKYNARNISGDAEAVFVGNPHAFMKAGKATRDLYEYLGRKSAPSPELQEWLERGGLYNLFQVAEDVGSINGLKVFRGLQVDKEGNLQKLNVWKQYWRGARMATDFREAVLRYASYLDYRDQTTGNKAGKPKNYGASIPEEVDAMRDPRDKAFKLSNDLLGAYDEVTVMGQWLREHLFPFWSWQEVNAKRYYRLFKNSIYESSSTGEAGRRFVGKGLKISGLTAFRIGKFLLKATAVWSMLQAYNNLVFPDEEKDLDEKTRSRVHIILGRRADGSVIYFDRLGMLGDFLSWFGLDEAPHYVSDFLNNKKTAKEIAVDMAKAPANKFWQGTGLPKTAAEFAMGRNTYPDVFKSRNMRDRWQYLFQSFALGDEYAALTEKPSRGAGRAVRGLFAYEVDPLESAYNEVMSLKSDFNSKRGKPADVSVGNDKSNAAYYLKLALRYGDVDTARKQLAEYKALGGTPQGLQASIKALSPLSGLNEKEKEEFLKTLTADEREKLAKAQTFFDTVLDRSDEVGPADLLPRPIAKDVREPVDKELHRLGVSFPFPQNEMALGNKKQQLPQARFDEFQQRVAETFYKQLGDLISKPIYQRMSDDDRRLAIEDFKQAWIGNERRRLHGQLVTGGTGASGRETVEARKELIESRLKERELGNKDFFIRKRQIERRLKPRSEIQIGESPQ